MKDNPDLAKWWIDIEIKFGSTFKKGESYSKIFNLSKYKDLFSEFENESITCNCTD